MATPSPVSIMEAPPIMCVAPQPNIQLKGAQPQYEIPMRDSFRNQTLITPEEGAMRFARNVTSTSHEVASARPSNYKRIRIVDFASKPQRLKQKALDGAMPSSDAPKTPKSADRPLHKRRRLNANRPLPDSLAVNPDVWALVLVHCDPRFLLQAKIISRAMHDLLSKSSAIWRQSREKYLPRTPPCPSQLTEQQYVELLVGKGCQNSRCPTTLTCRVAWAFGGRLCKNCIFQMTIKVDHIPIQERKVDGYCLLKAIPLGRLTAHGMIKCPELDEYGSRLTATGHVVLRKQWEQLRKEFLETSQNNEEPAIRRWYDERCCNIAQHELEMTQIEDAGNLVAELSSSNKSALATAKRRSFFISKAAMLSPPISERTLICMSAFLRAIGTGNSESDRSWEELKVKILPYRDRAEHLGGLLAHRYMPWPDDPEHPQVRLIEHRRRPRNSSQFLPPEQEFVTNLGRQELQKCIDKDVADEDLLLLTLKNVFDHYNGLSEHKLPQHRVEVGQGERPFGLNFDGIEGSYNLTFDDAAMVVKNVIEPAVSNHRARAKTVLESLKCVACGRSPHAKLFNFVEGMEHIYQVHATRVGKEDEFFCQYVQADVVTGWDSNYGHNKFPFYVTPWSRCLPLVPKHRKRSDLGTWHPDNDWDYVQISQTMRQSAFANKMAVTINQTDGSFIEYLKTAFRILHSVNLPSSAMVKIALSYANALADDTCSLTEFVSHQTAFREINPRLDFRFMCGICLSCDTDAKTRFTGRPVPIHHLVKHWHKSHAGDGQDWQRLLSLPSDSEVFQMMVRSDETLQKQKDEINAKQTGRGRFGEQKVQRKMGAILDQTHAMTAFNKLFPSNMDAEI